MIIFWMKGMPINTDYKDRGAVFECDNVTAENIEDMCERRNVEYRRTQSGIVVDSLHDFWNALAKENESWPYACPTCKGTGYHNTGTVECDLCGGMGDMRFFFKEEVVYATKTLRANAAYKMGDSRLGNLLDSQAIAAIDKLSDTRRRKRYWANIYNVLRQRVLSASDLKKFEDLAKKLESA